MCVYRHRPRGKLSTNFMGWTMEYMVFKLSPVQSVNMLCLLLCRIFSA